MLSRAAVLLVISQVIFLISGFGVNAGLARLLGPIDYGTFGLVLSILVVIELFVITGIPEAIQKYGGENPGAMAKLVKKTIGWQTGYCFVIFIALWFFSPFIARFFDDEKITYLLRLAGLDIIFYGLYKYFLGVQNGLHKFVKYTILGITYSLSRLFIILGLVWFGFSVKGALIGNFLASIVGLVLALIITRLPKLDSGLDEIPFLSFVAQNVIYFVGLNMLFSIDLWFVKYFLSDLQVGYYVSASSFAKLSYFISIGLSAVLLPSLSLDIREKDSKRVKQIIQESFRYLLIFLVLINSVVITNSKGIIQLFYGKNFIDAFSILNILIVGISLVTLMAVFNTIMISYEKMKTCFLIISGLVLLDVLLNVIFIPKFGINGAAYATFITGLSGMVFTAFFVIKDLNSRTFLLSILRIGAAAILTVFIASFLEFHVIINSLFISLAFVAFLLVMREINSVDVRRLKESIGFSS